MKFPAEPQKSASFCFCYYFIANGGLTGNCIEVKCAIISSEARNLVPPHWYGKVRFPLIHDNLILFAEVLGAPFDDCSDHFLFSYAELLDFGLN
ncbi:MAG: hypothetical protein WCA08_03005 [Desulfoferrobacter sp.]